MEHLLKKIGLSEKAAKIYLGLLEFGPLNANILAKMLGIERTVTYNTLNNLLEKGLVNYVIKEKKKLFSPADPENLLKEIKEKEAVLSSIIPKLKAMTITKPVETSVKVYEGLEGLKVLFNLAIKTKEEILIFGGTGKTYERLPLLVPHKEKEAIRKKLRIRVLFNYTARNHPFGKLPIVKSRYLPKGYENTATTCILGEIIALFSLEGKPIVVLITNKPMAKGYKNLFEFLWVNGLTIRN